MIAYSFRITNVGNFQQINSAIESKFSVLMHTTSPLPSSLAVINGSLGLSASQEGSTLYVQFFESDSEYILKDDSGNVIYQSKPLLPIPSQSQVQSVIEGLL